ncbi:glycosyltransferase family 2 protein [Nonomuraea sp. NPDC049714]|uniref:glycosyltransferase family 2 protein n=1 Tax=Nonomuraea sp. NPDC049714 TaxID=3364357 RepID=UPI00379DCE37
MPSLLASVIIPCHNRTTAIRNVLASLREQDVPADTFEVVVVDDGSAVPLDQEIPELNSAPSIKFLRHTAPKGVQAARNAGVELAGAEVLIFLDVDCIARSDLVANHIVAHEGRDVAICGFTSTRELSPSSWRLLMGDGWDFSDSRATFARAAGESLLHDPLTELLAMPTPVDWSFFWTHNVSVTRAAFHKAGGFSEDFPFKGVEDVEMGYRLYLAGFPTIFDPNVVALHQPHVRDRNGDIIKDRQNELVFVGKFPNVEVEAVCSYDIVRARELAPVLQRFAGGITTESADCSKLAELEELHPRISAADRILLAGSMEGWPKDLPFPVTSCFPGHGTRQEDERLSLIGTRIPYSAGAFDLGIITDYWRHFPERTIARIFSELLRTCREVLVLSKVSTAPAAAPDAELAAALHQHDQPYWEFTVEVKRELHQFDLAELAVIPDGPAGFLLTEAPWERVGMGATMGQVRGR